MTLPTRAWDRNSTTYALLSTLSHHLRRSVWATCGMPQFKSLRTSQRTMLWRPTPCDCLCVMPAHSAVPIFPRIEPDESLASTCEPSRAGYDNGRNRSSQTHNAHSRSQHHPGRDFHSQRRPAYRNHHLRAIYPRCWTHASKLLGSDQRAECYGQLSDRTGGEAFFLGLQAPVSFRPFLDRLQNSLDNQFLLEFGARPDRRAGLRSFNINTSVAGVELISADSGWVPAAGER